MMVKTRSQFHYGSIKTGSDFKDKIEVRLKSQFHYGSIKTTIQKLLKSRDIILSLNSTMVRLKHLQRLPITYWQIV